MNKRQMMFLAAMVFYWVTGMQACDIPVFRFALEEWESDAYRVTVFYRESVTAEAAEKLETLANRSRQLFGQIPEGLEIEPVKTRANLTVRLADLEQEQDGLTQQLWQTQNTDTLPWAVVRYPRTARMKHALWTGPLEKFDGETLLDSPARHRIFEEISQGASAVWVVLETGNKPADEQAAAALQRELAKAEKTLKLPEIDDADLDEMGLPLKIAFPIVRVSRADIKEVPFMTMLIKSEPQLMKHLRKPMAFPVYGRGRSLYGMAGEAINGENVFRACRILLESCKCEIKDDNPGTDLLFHKDWEGIFDTVPKLSSRPPMLVGLSDLIDENDESPVETGDIADPASEDQPTKNESRAAMSPVASSEKSLEKDRGYGLLFKTGGMVAGAVVLAVVGTVLIRKN